MVSTTRCTQPGKARLQVAIRPSGVDVALAVGMNTVQPVLRDDLAGLAVHGRRRIQRRVVIAAETIHRHAACTTNIQRACCVDCDIALRIRADTWRAQADRAARNGICGTHVDHRTGGQRQTPVGRAQVDDATVGRVDRQSVAVRIQHSPGTQRQAVACRQADRARLLAAGIDAAVDDQAAAINRHIDRIGLQFAADHQIALFDLEAARPCHTATRQALV